MKHDHFVVQSPDKPAQQLLLLFSTVSGITRWQWGK